MKRHLFTWCAAVLFIAVYVVAPAAHQVFHPAVEHDSHSRHEQHGSHDERQCAICHATGVPIEAVFASFVCAATVVLLRNVEDTHSREKGFLLYIPTAPRGPPPHRLALV